MASAALYFALVALTVSTQDKSPTPVSDIIECVQRKACKDAMPSTMTWADMAGIPVQTFTDGQSSYALAIARDGSLNLYVTLQGESKAGRLINLGGNGRVLSAELGRQPGEDFPMQMTPEQTAQQRELRKAYRSIEKASVGTWGEQHKSFWQEQADAAVAAIRRQMERAAGAQSTPTVFPSPRLAAVAYAVAHGFEIPRTNVILANEIETGQFNHGRGSPNDRARSLPVAESLSDSRAVAASLGPNVRTAPMAQIVSCPERECFASTKAHALLVDDLKDDSTGVVIKLYSPGTGANDRGTLLQAIVNTTKAPTGWTAAGFKISPQRIILR